MDWPRHALGRAPGRPGLALLLGTGLTAEPGEDDAGCWLTLEEKGQWLEEA